MLEMRSTSNNDSASPIITFDKDDEDTMDFVAASANLRSIVFGIETKSRFDIKQMAGNIIPAIATTNAIVAGLCVLQAFKILRGEYFSTREVFLSPFAQERLLASDRIRPPNPDCPVCSVAQTRVLVDLSRATLNDLVEDYLRSELRYGEEFVVNNDSGILYDVEETENLSRKLSELGIKGDTFLTVIDEDDENPRVNLVLNIQESTTDIEKPIKGLDIITVTDEESATSQIPRRKKPAAEGTNGHTNGTNGATVNSPNKKRTATEALGDELTLVKRAKADLKIASNGDDIILIDDSADGAILIDD